MNWTQLYNPLGNLLLSAIVAALPVIVLLGLLAFVHVRAHIAASAGLATAVLIAIIVYGMPGSLAFAAAANGAMYGLFPIGWIVLSAIFVYDITVKTGQFETVKHSIAGLADNRRIQAFESRSRRFDRKHRAGCVRRFGNADRRPGGCY